MFLSEPSLRDSKDSLLDDDFSERSSFISNEDYNVKPLPLPPLEPEDIKGPPVYRERPLLKSKPIPPPKPAVVGRNKFQDPYTLHLVSKESLYASQPVYITSSSPTAYVLKTDKQYSLQSHNSDVMPREEASAPPLEEETLRELQGLLPKHSQSQYYIHDAMDDSNKPLEFSVAFSSDAL